MLCLPRTARSKGFRLTLLASASVVAILAGAGEVAARSLGGRSPSPSAAAIAAGQAAQLEASRAAREAQNALKRTTLAIQAMHASQQAARDAARAQLNAITGAPPIPDGIGQGGLDPLAGGLWQGAKTLTGNSQQTGADGRTKVTIDQDEKKAILTWNTFNVGRNTDVLFDQDGTDWIALNRVTGTSAAPSQILGTMKAKGSVYVINQNGIIFGGASQVNVATLVASSLALSNEQFMVGLNTPVIGGIGGDTLPTFGTVPTTSNPNAPPPMAAGNVEVRKGAQITSGTNGLIGLFGTNVTNSGTIDTKGGQVLMAAGEQVRLVPQIPGTGMIGLRAYVSAALGYYSGSFLDDALFARLAARTAQVGMVVGNDGIITAEAGNITVVGATVLQNGVLRAVTTLDSPGSILIAGEQSLVVGSAGGMSRRRGTIVLGENSITQVVIDRSGVLGTGGSAGDSSIVRLSGKTVELKGKTGAGDDDMQGAYVQSQAGKIDIDLRSGDFSYSGYPQEGFQDPPQAPEAGTRFLMNAGATLDVAGVSDVEIPMESNSVLVEVRANELRDAPLQRDGILKGAKIWVDRRVSGKRADGTIWYGSELVDANEYIANVPTSMAERAVNGGTIAIHSNEVIVKPDAAINIGGGSTRYLDGYIKTTKLLGANGKAYDVGNADPDAYYIAFAGGFTRSNEHWDVTETWYNPLSKGNNIRFEKGYTAGADAGTLAIYAPAVALDGDIYAQAITGERQTSSPAKSGTLRIGSLTLPDGNFNSSNLLLQASYAPLASDFTMASTLGAERTSTLLISSDMLNESGLSTVDLHVNRNITFASDVDLELQPGGTLNVQSETTGGHTVVVDGSIRIAGGSVSIGSKGALTVEEDARIDVSGQWTNDFLSPSNKPRNANGGSISLVAGSGALSFGAGSVLAADAGATLDRKGKLTAGKAGRITLAGARAVGLDTVVMSAYGLAISNQALLAPAGGLLDLVNLPAVSINPGGVPAGGNTIGLDPSFFDRGGFSSFSFKLRDIQDGVTFAPKAQTRVLAPSYLSQASGAPIASVATPTALSEGQLRGVTMNMTLAGNFTLGANTVIGAGIGGSILLNGAQDITIAGKIEAAAGAITIQGNSIKLTETAQLLARGATRIVKDIRGVRSGEVLAGGSVTLSAQGEIGTKAGSLIDVSGTSGVIDILKPRTGLARAEYEPLELASSGGSISISGRLGLLEGALIGKAGGPGASGGSISFNMQPSDELAPRTQLEYLLRTLEPSCYGYGSGECSGDFSDAQEAIGFDLEQMFIDFGFFDAYEFPYTSFALSQALVSAAPASATGNIVFSDTATAAGGGINPEDYGLSPQLVAFLSRVTMELIDGTDFSQIFRPLAPMVVRPSSFRQGGFSNLTAGGTNLELDHVDIALPGSINVQGSIVNRNGTSSRLAAPLISIGGLTANAASALGGELTLQASLISVDNGSIRGFAQTNIETTDLRLGGPVEAEIRLDVDGDLVMKAGQIYPTTLNSATIAAGSSITVLSNGNPVAPLSAGGKLTLSAPIINQQGTLRAPFGQIVLDAGDTLTLGAGSITSVSGAGLTVPFGSIVDQVLWYADNPNTPITSPPEKRVTLKAPNVDTQSGAVIDLSGGGDLQAYQFIPGSGGSSDYLTYGNAVAVLPVSKVSSIAGQEIIHLEGGNGVPAGDYVVLPANYALLPGAYRLEALSGTTDYRGSTRLTDGSIVVAGWGAVSGTDIRDARSRAYKVSSIDTIRLRSEYKIWSANEYFASGDFVEAMRRQQGIEVTAIPRLPNDAGALQIEATVSALLNATLVASARPGSRGAVVDISADKIAVAGGIDASSYRAAGYLVLDAASLSAFGGESLLLGGTRRQTVNGLELDATASSLIVATDGTEANALIAPEILLASEDTIRIADGSIIEARGAVGGGSGNILISPAIAAVKNTSGNITSPARDYGAFVRVSNGASVGIVRTNAERTQGTLAVDGATLRGASITLDATMTTTVSGSAALLGQVLDVSSGRISIGTPPTSPDGLVLSGGSLAALLGASDLRLRSYSSIDFYGDVALGGRGSDGAFTLKTLLLDGATLNAADGAHVDVAAGEFSFVNTLASTGSSLGGTGGTLAVSCDIVSFGAGTKTIQGFDTIQVSAGTAIIGRGTGTTDFGPADLAFSAPRLTAESGASQDWTSTGTFTLSGMAATGGFETLGARLAITAASITQGSLIDLTAGSLTLRATSGDVTLAQGSITRAAGFSRTFYDQRADIAGGTVTLAADQGRVWAQAGSLVDVSRSGNGAAGTLSVATPQHAALLDGELRAGSGGNFTLDASGVAGFGALSSKLRQSGFDGDLSFRLRAGDVTLDGETRARNFALATDTGSITVTGMIDASGAAGGAIRLSAKQDLTVASGALLRADASDASKSSGLIELAAAAGDMRLTGGATIEALGGRNGNGEIRLRFQRYDNTPNDSNHTDNAVRLVDASATMTAAKIVAEAYRAYGTASVDATLPGALADASSFMAAHAAAIEASLGRAGDTTFHLVPGVELASTGDLTLSNDVDLHQARYDGEAGVLTLRAAGNLVLNGSLSDGFDSAAGDATVLTDRSSWSYRLVGGADLDAANALAVRPIGDFAVGASGNVGLGSGTIVRAGTGAISVAAGNDVVLADKTSVIYTAGAKISDPTLGGTFEELIDYTAPLNDDGSHKTRMPDFTQGGGDVRVSAQNDVKSLVASDQMIVDWLWREGYSNTSSLGELVTRDGSFFANQQTAWWINYATFQQGIAALGGGNVMVEAGRDVVNVSASTPTQGRVGGGRTGTEAKTAVITGGGDLTVRAGRDIVGGVYYVDHGTGTLAAGGAITSDRTQVVHDADSNHSNPRSVPIRTVLALGDAALNLTAGGNIDLATASNPTQWMRSKDQVPSTQPPFPIFSTYGENTELTLLSTGGDVTLWNTPIHLIAAAPAWSHFYDTDNSSTWEEAATTLVYYPGKITAIAAAGDINVPGGMVMYPSATGNLDLWAQHSVNLTLTNSGGGWIDGAVSRTLVMSPTDPAFMPSILRPRPRENMQVPLTVVHASDSEPSRIYANEGDITEGTGGGSNVGGRGQYYAEQVRFRAGRDINNLRVRAQNSNLSDLSLFQAGRDLNLGDGRISIDGPGFVLAEAGRDVFLGRGQGIETTGNGEVPQGPGIMPLYNNPALPREGADLLVLSGTADAPRYDDFIDAYLDPTKNPVDLDYFASLVRFMRQVTGDPNLSLEGVLAGLRDPRFADHRKFLINYVLSRELRAAGRGQLDGLGPEGLGYERGYKAIATLFPGAEKKDNTAWQGDVIMDQSMIRTYLGGDLDIVAPGGFLQVSTLSSNAVGDRNGILTINGGEIRITTGLGTIINKSRVLTARGGDITIWSTFGDIDAGKGRKSSLTTPPTTYLLSTDGTISYRVNPTFSGSGISTQKGAPDAPESDVDLYAPSGIINAGDAGIKVSGNVYLGAILILGAENISAGGEVKGLPTAETGTGALSVEGDANKDAANAAKDATQSNASEQPSVIIVEVLGYGGAPAPGTEEDDEEKRRKRDKQNQSYNETSPYQVLGVGALTDAETAALAAEKRAGMGR